MITTLIDNATVSSVQRALGKAQLRDLSVLDVEHAALERLVEAILLSDRVVVPDNYKEAFTPARKSLLEKFGVEFLSVDQEVDASLNMVARELIRPWFEAFDAGKDRGLFKEYLGQVDAFTNFIWEHSNSEFFLVFRAHGIEKDSPLIEALLSSPRDVELGKHFQIIAEDGRSVYWNRLSPHVQSMLSVMGWLGHQYIWHQAFAAARDLVYSPHPLREFFANDFLSRVRMGSGSAISFSNTFRMGVETFQGKLKANLETLGALNTSTVAKIPPLLPMVAAESSTADDFLKTLGQMRSDRRVTELRLKLSEAHSSAQAGDFTARSALLNDFEKIGTALFVEKGLDRRLLSIKPPTTISGIKLEGDDAGIKLPILPMLYRQYFLHRTYRAFLRDVMADLAAPSQYGAIKTKLNSWVWPSDSAAESQSRFYVKDYSFPSQYHRPLKVHNERY